MAKYRYQFCDLWTDQHIVDLPLLNVRFDRRIIKAGSFSATVPIPNRTVADQVARIQPRTDADISTGPGRTIVHIWRNGQLWGSYVVWRGTVDCDERGRLSAQITGASLESWLHRRYLREALTFTGVDQLVIARSIVTSLQHWSGNPTGGWANIGMTVAGPATSGTLRDRSYPPWDATTAGERLEQLSEVIGGPEWYIRTYPGSGGARVREFYVAPMIGNQSRLHTFTQPGNVMSWRQVVDATEAATQFQVRGEVIDPSTDRRRLYLSGSTRHEFLAGWARLETTRDYPTASVGTTLQQYAQWWAAQRAGAEHSIEVTVRLGETPTLTPDRLGERARLVLVNDWYPPNPATGAPSFDQARRVIGMEIEPAERGRPERATLMLEGPRQPSDTTSRGAPLYPREISDILARTSRELRAIVGSSAPIGT